ncbi:MAG TPA: diaminopimelate epimerase [Actinomycetes bacterium]|nr:diaminopimelate epimerase [Actinomycetes bacterium]
MEFVKAHGTGNDFVVVEDLADRYRITPELVRAVCDRHFGIGADGLIRIAPGNAAPYFMDYRNADGSLAEMCGNGVRVVGKYLGDRGYVGSELDLETRAGVKHLELHADDRGGVDRVTVDMGPPVLEEQDRKLEVDGRVVTATCVSMGNPHAVLFVDDVDAAPVRTLGPALERHPAFPEGTNVEFVQVVDDGVVRQRTWERGVGETLACGSGACAVAAASQARGLAGRPLRVELRGGHLELDWTPGGGVRLSGPAREVAHGTIAPDLLAGVPPVTG